MTVRARYHDSLPQLLLSAEQMQAVDTRAIEQGIDSFMLMQAAGRAVANVLIASDWPLDSIVVLAGPGNNGGDGAIAAHALAQIGCQVTLVRCGKQPRVESDAGKAFALWGDRLLVVDAAQALLSPETVAAISGASVIVDALFGAGLSRPLEGVFAEIVSRVNTAAVPVMAVDVPSGLNGNEHCVDGLAVQARATVTFFRYKPAHFLFPGRRLSGDVHLEQIGLTDAQLDFRSPGCWLNRPDVFASTLPVLTSTMHKFERGHVLVRGGPIEATGASRLSATTALACGAGLVTLATSREALAVNAAHLTAVMLRRCDSKEQWRIALQDQRINSVVVGPGNGVNNDTREAVLLALDSGKHCVLDADALSCWTQGDSVSILVEALRGCTCTAVLTPHEGEFRRLFGETSLARLPSKLHRALATAELTGSVVVYKGADTVVAAPDGRSVLNDNAPPWLATAGAGDVLAGAVVALLAQGMPAFEAACAAVWLHGEAATKLGYPMTAEQLATAIAEQLSLFYIA